MHLYLITKSEPKSIGALSQFRRFKLKLSVSSAEWQCHANKKPLKFNGNQGYAEKEGLPFIETSVLETTNAEKVSQTILSEIYLINHSPPLLILHLPMLKKEKPSEFTILNPPLVVLPPAYAGSNTNFGRWWNSTKPSP